MNTIEDYILAGKDVPLTERLADRKLPEGERYLKVTSINLEKMMIELVDIEKQRIANEKRTADILETARKAGYHKYTVIQLMNLTYNTKKSAHRAVEAEEYIRSTLYQDEPKMMPGVTQKPGMMPGVTQKPGMMPGVTQKPGMMPGVI